MHTGEGLGSWRQSSYGFQPSSAPSCVPSQASSMNWRYYLKGLWGKRTTDVRAGRVLSIQPATQGAPNSPQLLLPLSAGDLPRALSALSQTRCLHEPLLISTPPFANCVVPCQRPRTHLSALLPKSLRRTPPTAPASLRLASLSARCVLALSPQSPSPLCPGSDGWNTA